MTPSLFLTGAAGFVGRRVLDALVRENASDVRLLVRDTPTFMASFSLPPSWRCVPGSLDGLAGTAVAGTWGESLCGVDTVVHLASSTGKVSRATHERVIVGGTERLLSAARDAGVRRFLYVSSVAAGFADRRWYHYAEAKRAAEALVQASGMETLILRPTMVFGPGSATLDGLRRLARFPVPIVFGDGTPLVQPIHVGDLAALLVLALNTSFSWGGATVTVGGPEAITTEALLRRLRARASSGNSGDRVRFIHVPIDPLRAFLALAEPVALSLLPFTAGQLTAFANHSHASAPPSLLTTLISRLPSPLRGLATMLESDPANAS